ncbi:phage baseplate assembly protein V [Lentibacillus sp. Marseille-P4043]|uniref:phage baseplate assembly protein V n=1 Tax=Lentibacillus sp. Marseille-P4043 TaxID=2040293 RepID=UPI000D0B6EFE|nr:phage baseplate assembly protein V [Lentibacillus sp. Marseille-P4043]
MRDTVLRNMIRVGQVNSVNESNGTVQVLFEDKDNLVSGDLPLFSFEYDMPDVGDQVVCIFLANGIEQGFCLGPFFSEISKVPVQDKNIFRKHFSDGTYIQYDKNSQQLQITAQKPLTLIGDLTVEGNITATGKVTASNIGN